MPDSWSRRGISYGLDVSEKREKCSVRSGRKREKRENAGSVECEKCENTLKGSHISLPPGNLTGAFGFGGELD